MVIRVSKSFGPGSRLQPTVPAATAPRANNSTAPANRRENDGFVARLGRWPAGTGPPVRLAVETDTVETGTVEALTASFSEQA